MLKNILKNRFKIKGKRIFIYLLILLLVVISIFALWWNFIFFPDDFEMIKNEALKETEDRPFKKRSYDLIGIINSAKLNGDFSRERIDQITEDLKSRGFLIKQESLSIGNNSDIIHRAGTGHLGIWVDERSSILIPPGASVTYSAKLSKFDEIDFSLITFDPDSQLTLEIIS